MRDKVFPLEKKDVYKNFFRNKFLSNFNDQTEIPIGEHPGSFGYVRKYHTHEGIDLYCNPGDIVQCCEEGIITGVYPFTGEHCGSPWWNETWCVVVKHIDKVIVYGELMPFMPNIPKGYSVEPTNILGFVEPVLKKNKGRPMCMLHLEMYDRDITESVEWRPFTNKPESLIDPTDYLVSVAQRNSILRGVVTEEMLIASL